MARWGCARLLRFCWLRATGRQVLADAGRPELPERAKALVAALSGLGGTDRRCLDRTIRPWVQGWFRDLCSRHFHWPEQENPDETEWLRWAISRSFYRPLDALLRSVLRHMDRPERTGSTTPGSREPAPAATPPGAAERDRCKRDLQQDPYHQQALSRSRGRRRLVRRLADLIAGKLIDAGRAKLIDAGRALPARADEPPPDASALQGPSRTAASRSASPAPAAGSTVTGGDNLRDVRT
ncbi:MAG: hypothetical protein H6851_01410 [Geminicoccaceae bacterium]|nr:hypothetical protein [Geminicoccaceae bacterium]